MHNTDTKRPPVAQKPPTKDGRRHRGETRAMLIAAMTDPEGATCGDLQRAVLDQSSATTCGRLRKLVNAGVAFTARKQGGSMRYFATEALRDAWLASDAPAKKPRYVPVPTDHQKPPTYSAGSSKVAPRTVGDAVITSATRVTVAPTPLPRFHVPAEHRGAFSLAGVGRDVQTGRGWA